MPKPPPLTIQQRKKLAELEPALRSAVGARNCTRAKKLTGEIHHLLKATNHEVRLLKSKLWYFECVMEDGDYGKARKAFREIQRRAPKNSRMWLEASTLLAICYLRQSEWSLAEFQIRDVLTNDKVIRTPARRAEFRRNAVERFAEETLLAGSHTTVQESVDIEQLQQEAESLARNNSASRLITMLGEAVPENGVTALLRIDRFSKRQLPFSEAKLLPSSQQKSESAELGRTFFESAKRVIWRSFCDSESEIYRAWFEHGLKRFMGKFYVGGAIFTALAGSGLGIRAIAVTITAIVIKFGIEVYCERFKPVGTMIDHK